jgi:2,4-dienoyl-CoA reductase (NADPH2)
MDASLAQKNFPNIFAKGKIGKYETTNRVKWAACCVSNYNNRDGSYSEREYARDEVIGAMKCGISTNQGAYPDKAGLGKAYWTQVCIADDKYIPGLSRVADILHKNGSIAMQQILHAGRYGGIDLGYCIQPSAVPQTLKHFRPPKEMTADEIWQAVQDHADAAVRAQKAGFDAVEIASFMGYLMSCFLSPYTNRRTDEWGGTVEKRFRFMEEIIKATRKACGPDFAISVRLNGTELMDDRQGNTTDECLAIMELAEAAGVDLISMVIGWHESTSGALGRDIAHDGWVPLAANAKKRIKVPIAFGPRVADPRVAERAIGEGWMDFWEICRPGLADPQILQKTAQNRIADIKPCIADLTCLAKLFANQPYICSVNPQLGHEIEPEYQITPAVRRKKVVVVGGGVAGLECATTAVQRGHEVILYEKKSQLGGQVVSASREVKGGEQLTALVDYYANQARKLGITVKLGTVFDKKAAAAEGPDVIVVATGAAIDKPAIPGIDKPIVSMAYDVLEANPKATGKKVVVLGGGKVGLIVAEHFASQGNETWIVAGQRRVDTDVSTTFKWRHAAWVKEFNIKVLTESKITEVKDNGVTVVNKEGNSIFLEADMVIVAGPRRPENSLFTEIDYMTDETYIAGDAVVPRFIDSAIHEGFKVGVRI